MRAERRYAGVRVRHQGERVHTHVQGHGREPRPLCGRDQPERAPRLRHAEPVEDREAPAGHVVALPDVHDDGEPGDGIQLYDGVAEPCSSGFRTTRTAILSAEGANTRFCAPPSTISMRVLSARAVNAAVVQLDRRALRGHVALDRADQSLARRERLQDVAIHERPGLMASTVMVLAPLTTAPLTRKLVPVRVPSVWTCTCWSHTQL